MLIRNAFTASAFCASSVFARACQAVAPSPASSESTSDTASAMPTHEFAGAIAASLRSRQHRPPLEIPMQVLGQRTGADVAALRFRAQRFEDDRIEVARQPRGERARRQAPGVGNLVDRWGVVMIPENDRVRRPWRFRLPRPVAR